MTLNNKQKIYNDYEILITVSGEFWDIWKELLCLADAWFFNAITGSHFHWNYHVYYRRAPWYSATSAACKNHARHLSCNKKLLSIYQHNIFTQFILLIDECIK